MGVLVEVTFDENESLEERLRSTIQNDDQREDSQEAEIRTASLGSDDSDQLIPLQNEDQSEEH